MASTRFAHMAVSAAATALWALCSPAAVRAQAPSTALRVELAPLASPLTDALRIDRADLTGVVPLVWAAVRPARSAFRRLGLFAGSREVTERRQPTSYEVEGGALLRVFEGISLTSGYRVTGYHTEAVESGARSGESGGPFVALRWHF